MTTEASVEVVDASAKLPSMDYWIIVRLRGVEWQHGMSRHASEAQARKAVKNFQDDGVNDWQHVRLVHITEPKP